MKELDRILGATLGALKAPGVSCVEKTLLPAGGAPSFLKDRRMKEFGLNSGCHTRGPQGPGGVLCRETLLPRGRGPFFPKGQTNEGVWGLDLGV
jgi:hypothetical protein